MYTPFNRVLGDFSLPSPNITPFTYKDGATYLEVLKSFHAYITALADTVNATVETWDSQIVETINNANTAMAQTIADFESTLVDTLAAQDGRVDDKVATLVTYVNDEVAKILNASIETNDVITKQLLDDTASETRLTVNQLIEASADATLAAAIIESNAAKHLAGIAEEKAEAADALAQARANIEHKRRGAVSYEVITVNNPRAVHKVQAPEFRTDGTAPRSARRLIKQWSNEFGYGAFVNSDAAITVDSVSNRMHGINITGGVAYASFGDSPPLGIPGTELFDTEAIAYYKDGTFRYISVADGKTAQQYVDDGVVDTYGHGPVLVRDGVKTDWYTKPGYSDFVTKLSARTIIGQTVEGEVKIILIHGKTGAYGVSGETISAIAVEEGCWIAVNCDGGGSTQGVWRGYTFHASTDAGAERGVMGGIAITAQQVNEYDTGSYSFTPTALVKQSAASSPAMSVRAIGTTVFAEFNIVADTPVVFERNKWLLVSDDPVPEFFHPLSFQESRGTIAAGSGDQITASLTTDSKFYIRDNGSTNKNLATGTMSWRLKDYLGDRV